MARLVNVASPPALVVAVRVPPSAGLPVEIAAVTTTPACATGLFAASWSCTDGCTGNATPLMAAVEGWVPMASLVAVPAPMVMAVLVSGVSAPDVKRTV